MIETRRKRGQDGLAIPFCVAIVCVNVEWCVLEREQRENAAEIPNS
jgi:hypothetical protein